MLASLSAKQPGDSNTSSLSQATEPADDSESQSRRTSSSGPLPDSGFSYAPSQNSSQKTKKRRNHRGGATGRLKRLNAIFDHDNRRTCDRCKAKSSSWSCLSCKRTLPRGNWSDLRLAGEDRSDSVFGRLRLIAAAGLFTERSEEILYNQAILQVSAFEKSGILNLIPDLSKHPDQGRFPPSKWEPVKPGWKFAEDGLSAEDREDSIMGIYGRLIEHGIARPEEADEWVWLARQLAQNWTVIIHNIKQGINLEQMARLKEKMQSLNVETWHPQDTAGQLTGCSVTAAGSTAFIARNNTIATTLRTLEAGFGKTQLNERKETGWFVGELAEFAQARVAQVKAEEAEKDKERQERRDRRKFMKGKKARGQEQHRKEMARAAERRRETRARESHRKKVTTSSQSEQPPTRTPSEDERSTDNTTKLEETTRIFGNCSINATEWNPFPDSTLAIEHVGRTPSEELGVDVGATDEYAKTWNIMSATSKRLDEGSHEPILGDDATTHPIDMNFPGKSLCAQIRWALNLNPISESECSKIRDTLIDLSE